MHAHYVLTNCVPVNLCRQHYFGEEQSCLAQSYYKFNIAVRNSTLADNEGNGWSNSKRVKSWT